MCKPNLFIVGAPKCGTTAWVDYLSSHSQIFFSPEKEPHFFSTDFPDFRWAKTIEEYEKLFPVEHKNIKFRGEASIGYLYSVDAAENIAKYDPRSKILVFLRNPLDFLPSYHQQLLYNLDEDIRDFDEAYKKQHDRISKNNFPSTCREPQFLSYSKVARFGEQLERYYQFFPEENIKVVWFDEWTRNPQDEYNKILSFLDLRQENCVDFTKVNEAHIHKHQLLARLTQRPPKLLLMITRLLRRMLGKERLGLAAKVRSSNTAKEKWSRPSLEVQRKIISDLEDDIARLEDLTGMDLGEWRKIREN